MPSWDILIFLLITAASIIGGFLQQTKDKKKKSGKKGARPEKAKLSAAERAQREERAFRKRMLSGMELKKDKAAKPANKPSIQANRGSASTGISSQQTTASGIHASAAPRRTSSVRTGVPARQSSPPARKTSVPQPRKSQPASQMPSPAPREGQEAPVLPRPQPAMVVPPARGSVDRKDVRGAIHSRASLAQTIVLMEVLGPPRATRPYGAESQF